MIKFINNIDTPSQGVIYENNNGNYSIPRSTADNSFNNTQRFDTSSSERPYYNTNSDDGYFDTINPLEVFLVFTVLLFLTHVMALISIIQLNDRFGKFLHFYKDINSLDSAPESHIAQAIENNEQMTSVTETKLKETEPLKTQLHKVTRKPLLVLFVVSSTWVIILIFLYLNS